MNPGFPAQLPRCHRLDRIKGRHAAIAADTVANGKRAAADLRRTMFLPRA